MAAAYKMLRQMRYATVVSAKGSTALISSSNRNRGNERFFQTVKLVVLGQCKRSTQPITVRVEMPQPTRGAWR